MWESNFQFPNFSCDCVENYTAFAKPCVSYFQSLWSTSWGSIQLSCVRFNSYAFERAPWLVVINNHHIFLVFGFLFVICMLVEITNNSKYWRARDSKFVGVINTSLTWCHWCFFLSCFDIHPIYCHIHPFSYIYRVPLFSPLETLNFGLSTLSPYPHTRIQMHPCMYMRIYIHVYTPTNGRPIQEDSLGLSARKQYTHATDPCEGFPCILLPRSKTPACQQCTPIWTHTYIHTIHACIYASWLGVLIHRGEDRRERERKGEIGCGDDWFMTT